MKSSKNKKRMSNTHKKVGIRILKHPDIPIELLKEGIKHAEREFKKVGVKLDIEIVNLSRDDVRCVDEIPINDIVPYGIFDKEKLERMKKYNIKILKDITLQSGPIRVMRIMSEAPIATRKVHIFVTPYYEARPAPHWVRHIDMRRMKAKIKGEEREFGVAYGYMFTPSLGEAKYYWELAKELEGKEAKKAREKAILLAKYTLTHELGHIIGGLPEGEGEIGIMSGPVNGEELYNDVKKYGTKRISLSDKNAKKIRNTTIDQILERQEKFVDDIYSENYSSISGLKFLDEIKDPKEIDEYIAHAINIILNRMYYSDTPKTGYTDVATLTLLKSRLNKADILNILNHPTYKKNRHGKKELWESVIKVLEEPPVKNFEQVDKLYKNGKLIAKLLELPKSEIERFNRGLYRKMMSTVLKTNIDRFVKFDYTSIEPGKAVEKLTKGLKVKNEKDAMALVDAIEGTYNKFILMYNKYGPRHANVYLMNWARVTEPLARVLLNHLNKNSLSSVKLNSLRAIALAEMGDITKAKNLIQETKKTIDNLAKDKKKEAAEYLTLVEDTVKDIEKMNKY